jgi:hypothetical protein
MTARRLLEEALERKVRGVLARTRRCTAFGLLPLALFTLALLAAATALLLALVLALAFAAFGFGFGSCSPSSPAASSPPAGSAAAAAGSSEEDASLEAIACVGSETGASGTADPSCSFGP